MKAVNWSGFILPGATVRGRIWASVGALVSVGLTALGCTLLFGRNAHLPLLVAPIGASAVLLFAVPASPLAQPWSIIGGNTISALMGLLAGHLVHDPMTSVGLAVSLAIGAMSLTRCLHPPGGAAALTAVLGGYSALTAGWSFAFVPVAANSVFLVLCGWIFHRLLGHSYPHRALAETPAMPAAVARVHSEFNSEDLNAALREFGEPLDIDKGDLDRLLHLIERHAEARSAEHATT